jgi:hypothetical protein
LPLFGQFSLEALIASVFRRAGSRFGIIGGLTLKTDAQALNTRSAIGLISLNRESNCYNRTQQWL